MLLDALFLVSAFSAFSALSLASWILQLALAISRATASEVEIYVSEASRIEFG